MREIKFRAWDGEQMHPVEQWQNKSWVAVPIPTDDGNGGVDWHLEQRKIEDIQLMQYTGLKDKNGKEIYEGDVVKEEPWGLGADKNGRKDVISIEPSRGVVLGNSPLWVRGCEVIGNIYENPELLTNPN